MNNCEQLRQQIDAALHRIEEIKAQLDKEEREAEWPKIGNTHYTPIVISGTAIWCGDSYDSKRRTMHLVYRTPEENEAKAAWLANPRTEARFRLEQLEGFDVNGGFEVYYDTVNEELRTNWIDLGRYGGIAFPTEAAAKYAIDHNASDLMLVLAGEEVQS